MSEFNSGRPPTWRVMIYVFIAAAIPIFFFYPSLHTLSPTLKVVFWIYIVGVGLMPIYFGVFIPWFAKNKRSWILEHQAMLTVIFAVAMLLAALSRMFAR